MKAIIVLLLIAAGVCPLKTVYNRPLQPGYLQPVRQVPVLVYHNIKINPAKENQLFISEKSFARQMKALHDSGFHTILPNQLVAYYKGGAVLPSRPFIISFDDSHTEQYSLALPVLERHGFKAVFFVMTVTINKKEFLSSAQLKQLVQLGHVTGAHTWNHTNLKHIPPDQRNRQLQAPKKTIEGITGKPVDCFAYPFGAWDDQVLPEVRKAGFVSAFQLTGKSSASDPLLTIRRMMVNGAWLPDTMFKQMEKVFP